MASVKIEFKVEGVSQEVLDRSIQKVLDKHDVQVAFGETLTDVILADDDVCVPTSVGAFVAKE